MNALVTHLEKTLIRKDACTPAFMAALFTVAMTEQPNNPLTDKWIEDVHIYNGILVSHKRD